VQFGAILGLAGGETADSHSLRTFGGNPSDKSGVPAWRCSLDVLGASLLDRAVGKLKAAGVTAPTVLRDRAALDVFAASNPSKGAAFLSQWENAVAEYLKNGIQHLFILRIGVYCDIDLTELLRFHLQTNAPLTQAYADDGTLDIALVNASLLQNPEGAYRKMLSAMVPQQRRFHYRGYTNRLRKLRDLHRLTQDGLYQRCGLQPIGKQIRDGVWIGERARIDPTATVSGPAFIGSRSQVGPCCTIRGGSSIERDCKIDYGTLVQESCILQDTYAGAALDIRRAIVGGQTLFQVQRDVGVNLSDGRLIRANARPAWFAALGWARRGAAAD